MSGHPDSRTLALWVGGDLDAKSASTVGLHLDGCAGCRGTVGEIEKAQAMLRSAFPEPSEVDLQWVRCGVTRSLEDQRRTARWCWSLGSAAAALVLLFAGITHRQAPVPAAPVNTVQLPALSVPIHLALEIPEVKRTVLLRPERSRTRSEAGLRSVNFVPGADGSTQLRLTTADPNVIILLPPTERMIEQ
jgi:anti-sigma factor ChrR (cupin superfamily)